MARTGDTVSGEDPFAYSGEVWTDARGYATVSLPLTAGHAPGSVAYELHPFAPGVTAAIAAELIDGRFTITTDEPHVKVAWRAVAKGLPPLPTEKT